jgi:2-polyprenyl-3-methyl-5-hydroxy-6-metoxy-1,4-benzoquinol methylase
MGQLLQDTDLVLDGVEPNPAWAERAASYYREVWPATVESAPLPRKTYNAVICADVLEHTVDPAGVLRQLLATATDDALFLISLPNVAHIAVRLLLLFGQFPQMERGILDRTHLHFYTRRSARAMLEAAGLEVLRIRSTPFPLDELWRSQHLAAEPHPAFKLLMALQRLLLLIAPTLFAWQWVFVARPRRS